MSNFIEVPIKERAEGTPGIIPEEEFIIHLNTNQITVITPTEDPKETYVRLSCGATVCISMSYEMLIGTLVEAGDKVYLREEPEQKKTTTKGRKGNAKRKASKNSK